ncbi:MFS transporter [Nocardioides lentus]|uniref:MFS transporter n=1 Tax=Nocardioides lentus TaxID=338077 RepID=A0ABP5B5I8_9ACTN
MRETRALVSVLGVLLATGWAANHFSATIPVLVGDEGLSVTVVDAVFGLYAVGLVPGLFLGGGLSDRRGRPAVVLPGALVAACGTAVLLASHEPLGLAVGRFVVGLGAGLAVGAGTAWAGDLGGTRGTVLAGVFLTTGFGVGPLVSGALAQWGPAPLRVPFVLSLVLSLGAVAAAWRLAVPLGPRPGVAAGDAPAAAVPDPVRSVGRALAWSMPVAIVVFASATVVLVTLPPRLPADLGGPMLQGVAAISSLGAGIVVQTVARLRAWGPRAGVVGLLLSASGFGLLALGGEDVGVPLFLLTCVVMGLAYGLCLREGLLDVSALAPASHRGVLTGFFYVVTYVGFGLPLLLTVLAPVAGTTAPVLVLAASAVALALLRSAQLRGGHPAR